MTRFVLAGSASLFMVSNALAADLMITDSGAGDRVMLFSGVDGSLIDVNWITDLSGTFCVHHAQGS